ncbi:hypothetical protein Smp_139030 [Schistosoma mansoni]|uniref:hypothetical protein n=1 Tax=Schistosoma mansoni TaxID=6183 RepID=UPI00022DC7A3|nr:hypothetical protein Smp_139030 [Schistosoma mansoni]|eukprot:XP_018653907.1 hypothetical protein Smp_139030 [Schistosoma mansoni]
MKESDKFIPSCEHHATEELSSTKSEDSNLHNTSEIPTSLPSRIELVRPIYHQISDFCFDFDSEGILRHIQTGDTFCVKVTSTGPSLKRQEIIRAICTRLIRQRLFALNMESSQIPIPGHPTHCMRVLHSKNFFTHKGPIIILLQGGGIAQAGVWAPRLLLHPQHGLQSGSQISLVKKAHEQGYAIAIINANEHVPSEAEMDAMETFPNPSCPLFNVTECTRIDPNLKSPDHDNNHDVPIYLTLPDHSNKLVLPVLDNKSHHPVALDSNLENPILFVPCKSSAEQKSKQLFRSYLTRAPSSSSALSWLLTGSNSTSSSTMRTNSDLQKTPVCCVNSICSTNETRLTSSTTDLTLNTHVKSVGSTVSAPSPSSSSMLNATHSLNYESQSQKPAFLVPSNSIALKNLTRVPQGRNIVSDNMNSLNSSNCQPFVENSTCVINPGNNITAVKKSSIKCHFPSISVPTASTTLPTTPDIPSYSIENRDRNFPKGRSLNNDPIVFICHFKSEILSHITSKKSRLSNECDGNDPSTQVAYINVPSDYHNNDINNTDKSKIRFTRRRHLSSGPILMTHKNENGTRKSAHILEPTNDNLPLITNDYEQSQQNNKPLVTVNTIPDEIGEMLPKVSTGRLWFDRRIYGPWRHHVTPEASRRAFWLPDDNDLLAKRSSKKNASNYITNPAENRLCVNNLPALSGSDLDAMLFAKHGGVIPKSVGIWSDINSNDNNNSDEFLQLRLARAWQRKAERLWRELTSRVKAVVFTDSADVLDLCAAGVGWGLNILNEQSDNDSELPSIYKPTIYQQNIPEKVLQFREWLSQNSVNYVAANLKLGTRLNPQVNAQRHAIPTLSSSTTEHDLIPSTVLHHIFDFFRSKLQPSYPKEDSEHTTNSESPSTVMENSTCSILPSVHP